MIEKFEYLAEVESEINLIATDELDRLVDQMKEVRGYLTRKLAKVRRYAPDYMSAEGFKNGEAVVAKFDSAIKELTSIRKLAN